MDRRRLLAGLSATPLARLAPLAPLAPLARLAPLAPLAPLAAAGAAAGCRGDAAHVLMGMQVPRVRGTTSGGLGVDFSALGRAALIRFWGLWCGPCTRDEPYWQDVVRDLRGRADLTILTVHVGRPPADGPGLAEWAARQPPAVAVPVVDDASQAITTAFRIPGTPSTLLVDAGGRVVEHAWAFRSARGVRSFIRKVDYILDRARERERARPGGGEGASR